MTYEEYKLKVLDINNEANHQKKLLIKAYCDSNNPYKIGDIVTDHIGSIKIEKISYHMGTLDKPCCVYTGVMLKKDLTPTKKQEKRNCYQSNILLA